jgi:hypothetical protein
MSDPQARVNKSGVECLIAGVCFSAFFKEEYRREFDKMWKNALQKVPQNVSGQILS